MDIINKINNFYFQSTKKHYNTEYQQLKNLLDNYNIRVKNLTLKPYFITREKRVEFSKITEILLNVFEKLTSACYNNNGIRNLLSINGHNKEYCTHFNKQEQEEPHIAVVCSRNSFIRNDVNVIIEYLNEKNPNVNYADPRDFIYDGKVLKLNGERVDIVYGNTLKDFFRTESAGKIHSNFHNKIIGYTKYACLHNRYMPPEINYDLVFNREIIYSINGKFKLFIDNSFN